MRQSPSPALVFLGCLLGLALFCEAVEAKSGRVFRALANDAKSRPVILEYSKPISARLKEAEESKSPSKIQRDQHAVVLADAPDNQGEVPTFASELSASIMSEEVQQKLDERYLNNVQTFMFFHGYEASSRDARSRTLYNITPEEDIRLRKEMAKSLAGYMVTRGIPKFFKTREDTKHLGETYEEVIQATHADLQISGNDPETGLPPPNPWRFKTGFNLLKLTAYARFTNETWVFEAKQGNILNDRKNIELNAGRQYYRNTFGNRYYLNSKTLGPYYRRQLTKDMAATVSTSLRAIAPRPQTAHYTATIDLQF